VNAFFSLLEQLVALSAPSVVALQSLLGVTLLQVPNPNTAWRFYEAHTVAGLVAHVDYREPRPGAAKQEPFLVLELRGAPVHLHDLEDRYGEAQISDLSVHHPQFIGYRFPVRGRCVAADVDSQTHAVLSVSVDYSRALVPGNAVQGTPADAPAARVCGPGTGIHN